MSLQWYPGHMTKARRELGEKMPSQHVVLEVLDARAPLSSANPLIGELRGGIPAIKILTRSDLADPVVTAQWIRYLESNIGRGGPVRAFASTTDRPVDTRKRVFALCKELGLRHTREHPLRALITGIPNVGKSTLINILMDRAVAQTGDKPAITKKQQHVVLGNGMILTDSPGLLWPKIEDEHAAFRIAIGGSIPDTAVDYMTLAMFLGEYLLAHYAPIVVARFKLPETPASPEAMLLEVGRRRGCLQPGGTVDLHKASEVLIREFRAGSIGRISLESPPSATPLA